MSSRHSLTLSIYQATLTPSLYSTDQNVLKSNHDAVNHKVCLNQSSVHNVRLKLGSVNKSFIIAWCNNEGVCTFSLLIHSQL